MKALNSIALVAFLFFFSPNFVDAQYIVNVDTDLSAPGGAGAGVTGDFRYCIEQANGVPGSTITFAIPGAGPHTINLTAQINIINSTFVDGTSQAGQNRIILDGGGVVNNCIVFFACCGQNPAGAIIDGLIINNFIDNGITLNNTTDITVRNCYVGVESDGITAAPVNSNGILIFGGGSLNFIEDCLIMYNGSNGINMDNTTSNTIRNNVCSGNVSNGINLANGTSNNTMIGNYIGVDPTGLIDLGNGSNGINIILTSIGNKIGGAATAERNIISGNQGNGIYNEGCNLNTIQGNYIGTDKDGANILSNEGHGIQLTNGSGNNIIGGAASGEGNLISGNGSGLLFHGVYIEQASNFNLVQGNLIGTDASGMSRLANTGNGVSIGINAISNTVGGANSGEGNLISGNGFNNNTTVNYNSGISMAFGANDNTIQGNIIGLNINGTAALPNGNFGIWLNTVSDITIGGGGGARNIISGNGGFGTDRGLHIEECSDIEVYNNIIGFDINGTSAVGNGREGIALILSNNVTIGSVGLGNVIGNNGSDGIFLYESSDVVIKSNLIGVDINGNGSFGNANDGIALTQASISNTIGSIVSGEGNVIKNNGGNGVDLSIGSTISNTIIGNSISCNVQRGIELNDAGNNNYASSGSGSSSLLYVNNASSAPSWFGVAPANATIHVYEIGSCSSCSASDGGQQQGDIYLGSTTADGSGDWTFNSSATNIVVTATDGSGNTSEFSQCVSVCTDPVSAVISPSPSIEICADANAVLTATAGVSGAWSYTWSRGGVDIFTSGSNTYSTNLAGTYAVRINDSTDPNNTMCQATSSTMQVIVNDLPIVNPILGPDEVCDGDIESYNTNTSSSYNYSWSLPSGAIIQGVTDENVVSIDFDGASTGDLSVIATDPSSSCSSTSVSKNITVNSLPILTGINGSNSVCENSTELYTVEPSGLVTYTWNVTNGTLNSQGGQNTSITWGSNSGVLSVSAIDANTCISEIINLPVTVNSNPVITGISGDGTPNCNESGVSYTVAPANSGSNYTWTVPNGASIASGATGSGNTTITVDFGMDNGSIGVIEEVNGCASSVFQLPIELNGCGLNANFSIIGTDTICVGSSVTFHDETTGNPDAWLWDFDNGSSPPSANTQGDHTVTYSTVGSKTITLTATENGFDDTETKVAYVVVLDTTATSSVVGNATVCPNSSGEVYQVDDHLNSSYAWSIPSGASFVGPQNGNSITVDWGINGGVVSVQETNENGCPSNPKDLLVSMENATADAGPINVPSIDLCGNNSGDQYDFSIAPVNFATSYNWVIPSGATITSGSGTESISVDFGATYGSNLTIEVTPVGYCGSGSSSFAIISVGETVTPSVVITPNDNNVCASVPVMITAFPQGGGSSPTYDWYVNGQLNQSGALSTYTGFFNDDDSVNVIMRSSESCTTQSESSANSPVIINVLDTPIANAGLDTTISFDDFATLSSATYRNNTTSSGVTYFWTSSVDDAEISLQNPSTLYDLVQAEPTEKQTTYYLTVSKGQCSAYDSMIVTIDFTIWIPTGFSPNNDAVNDLFQIQNIEKYPGNRVEVYNRWGSLVYEADDYGIAEPLWDGTVDGKDLPMATYYYVVTWDSGNGQQAGPLTIIK